jgi:hypothetical protein
MTAVASILNRRVLLQTTTIHRHIQVVAHAIPVGVLTHAAPAVFDGFAADGAAMKDISNAFVEPHDNRGADQFLDPPATQRGTGGLSINV